MITQTTLANKIIAENGTSTMEEILLEIIREHDTAAMEEGIRYYRNEHDILNRKIEYYKDGSLVEDETAANNKLPHNWHKVLVDQKANYLVGKPVTFSRDTPEQEDKQDEFLEAINDLSGEQFDDDLHELCEGASNKGVEWLHVFINEENEFDYIVIDAREGIPIWETSRQKELQAFIRYYIITVNDEERIRAEYWTKGNVTYYVEGDDGELKLDDTKETNPAPHFWYNDENRGWGKVPFIDFRNNKDMIGDLNSYKALIDNYDLNTSDLANDLEEIQEAIWILKNYSGQSLDEFQENLRKYKALNVDNDGGAETESINIPVEAKEKHLDRLEQDIVVFGQGVNPKQDVFGANPSGVSLKFMYALLDLKADKTERKFQKAIRKYLWFIAEYLRIVEKKDFDHKSVDITFNKSFIINETELIDSVQKSKGIVSDETALANHPWVDDPEAELEKVREQKDDIVDLDDFSDNEDPDEE